MPSRLGRRPLKAWTYAGVYGRELMICAATVRIGPARQAFWAVWDRGDGRLRERTRFARRHRVRVTADRLRVADGEVAIDLELSPGAGIEAVCPAGDAYAWTRKTPVRAQGTVALGGRERRVEADGLLDESAGYHPRHTAWRWCAGVGTDDAGRPVAWNLVTGINDPPEASERTVWVQGRPDEVGPVTFAPDLSTVSFAEGGELRFGAEAVRRRRDELLIVASDYAQPFGTFTGALPGAGELVEGFGVMERHEARW